VGPYQRRGRLSAELTTQLAAIVAEDRGGVCSAGVRGLPLLLGDLELLDEAVEPLQRLVEGHELA
jgi:hypothetical protein